MRVGYVSLEDAHPMEVRPVDKALPCALLTALRKSAQQGNLRIPIPDSIRNAVLLSKRRHAFNPNSSEDRA